MDFWKRLRVQVWSMKRTLSGKCSAMRGWRALKHRVQKRNAGKCAWIQGKGCTFKCEAWKGSWAPSVWQWVNGAHSSIEFKKETLENVLESKEKAARSRVRLEKEIGRRVDANVFILFVWTIGKKHCDRKPNAVFQSKPDRLFYNIWNVVLRNLP